MISLDGAKMSKFSPTRAQKIAVLKDIRYEIESLLATPRYDSADEVIRETVYFRKMAHARALHTFSPLRRQSDGRTTFSLKIIRFAHHQFFRL